MRISLIEVGVAVVIAVLLATVSLPDLGERQTRVKIAITRSQMFELARALEAYVVEAGDYPPDLGEPSADYPALSALTTPTAYLNALPHSPFAEFLYDAPDNFSRPMTYQYVRESQRQWRFELLSVGPDFTVDWTPGAVSNVWIYDPSNGVVSTGDLLLRCEGHPTVFF